MEKLVIFKGTYVILLAVIISSVHAAPPSRLLHGAAEKTEGHQSEWSLTAYDEKIQILAFPHKFHTRNYFEDLINSQLNMSVKELLEKINETFKGLDRVTKDGVTELNTLLNEANSETRNKIIELREKSIGEVFEFTRRFLDDLGLVIPALTGSATNGPAADIIYAILRKTLEEFVKAIANAMETSLNHLDGTMDAFKELADKPGNENIKGTLERISDNYWNQGRTILRPMIDQLRSLLSFNWIYPEF